MSLAASLSNLEVEFIDETGGTGHSGDGVTSSSQGNEQSPLANLLPRKAHVNALQE
jgi:hypothetical protein